MPRRACDLESIHRARLGGSFSIGSRSITLAHLLPKVCAKPPGLGTPFRIGPPHGKRASLGDPLRTSSQLLTQDTLDVVL